MTLTERITADLEWVAAYWPDLTESRLPGTARPWRSSQLTPEARAELDAEARIERLERTGVAPGEAPAPLDVAVLDAMTSILADAETLADRLAPAAYAPAWFPSTSALADARPYLHYAVACLPLAAQGPDGRDLTIWAADLARGMADETQRTLSLIWDGQSIRVICPWCKGGWFGDRTWWVRVLPGDIIAIVCESGICSPNQNDVGTWYRGQPVWPIQMWPWLAKQVTAAERRERMSA